MNALHRLAALALSLGLSALAFGQTANLEQAERISFQSLTCPGENPICSIVTVQGYLFAKPGQDKVVILTHGSQGIDSRLGDWTQALQAEGFATLILDHWGARGIKNTYNDYTAASKAGANELMQAYDAMMAIKFLKTREFKRFGFMGESQGGAAAQFLARVKPYGWLNYHGKKAFGESFTMPTPPDVIVAMYPSCSIRDTRHDTFNRKPFLFVVGEKDSSTPAKYCVQFTHWMNERGADGNAKIAIIPGAHHSFDAPYMRSWQFLQSFKGCDLLMDEHQIKEVNSGRVMPRTNDNMFAMLKECSSIGLDTGRGSDKFIGVSTWIAHFKQHL
ncbi:Dienelactone hydrolase family protein [compost metagenome]